MDAKIGTPVPGARSRARSLSGRRHLAGHPSPTRFVCCKSLFRRVGGWVGRCVDSPYQAVLAVKVCVSAWRSLAPFGLLRTLTAVLRRKGFGLGQSRLIKHEVLHFAAFLVLDCCSSLGRVADP